MSYQVMPSLSEEEYNALKADIKKRGVLVPIEVDEETGEVLDGYHRMRICQELGIEPPIIKRQLSSDNERIEHALVLNIMRRQMGPISWANAFKKLAEARGARLGSGRGDPTGKVATVAALAQEIGVKPRTARHRLATAEKLADTPDLAEKVDRGEMEVKRALRVKREREAEQRATQAPEPPNLPPEIKIHHCDFRNLQIEPESVDLIFTDPPYPKEFLPLWSDLGEFAAKTLKIGHLLIAYTGSIYLPEILERLSEHLEYVWVGGIVYPSTNARVWPKRIIQHFKPLLFFSRGQYEPRDWISDTAYSESRQKEGHEWQQSLGPAKYYIEKLTGPNDLVVDPFLGAGTTAVAAKQLGRAFVGCDCDIVAYTSSLERVSASDCLALKEDELTQDNLVLPQE